MASIVSQGPLPKAHTGSILLGCQVWAPSIEMRHQTSLAGHLGGSVLERLPSAQGMILGSWDGILHRAPRKELASPSVCVSASLSLSASLMNK